MTLNRLRQTRLFKMTNVVLIYALLLNVTVPFAQTMDELLHVEDKYTENLVILPETGTYKEESIPSRSEEKAHSFVSEAAEVSSKLAAVSVTSGSPGAGGGISINTPDDLVDPFTGDFNYSIPLMDVEGYPITLSYNSNVTMNTDASWVGLGWNLNVGSVEREMRGIPDEFNGTQNVVREVNQLDDITTAGYKKGKYWGGGLSVKLYDIVNLTAGYNASKIYGHYNNSYLGIGRTFDKSTGWNAGVGVTLYYIGLKIGGSGGKYYNYDSKRGVNLGSGGGLSGGISVFDLGVDFSTYASKNFNSREGMTGKTITRGWGWDAAGIVGGSYSRTSTVQYGSQTQVPRIQLNSNTLGFTGTIDRYISLAFTKACVGLSLVFGNTTQFYGSSRQEVKNGNTVIQPAIGFLHSSKKMTASGFTLPIMDFNRSNDTRYSDEMTNLPFSMQTFDLFYANAMGMQGTFRAHRTDAGTYVDAKAVDKSAEISTTDKQGGSILPPTYEKEKGFGTVVSVTSNSKFTKINESAVLEFTETKNPVTGFDDAVYFKGVGENTPTDASLYANTGGFSPARAVIVKAFNEVVLGNTIIPDSGPNYPLPDDGKVTLSKPTMATYFKPRTVSELMASPIKYDTSYSNYAAGPNPAVTQISRKINDANIISKIEVTSDEGTFYGYGIPSFSNSSSQVMFNIGSNTGNPSITPSAQGLIQYSTGDNTVSNSKGLAHYYDKTTVPAYAESFLLTDIHSSDYVDRTGNGPSLDDIGNYYKFNYRKLHDNYHWRFPMGQQMAFYIEGTLGSELDDIATYNAGTKQVWVTHSVESKNYIAEFILEDNAREDGYGIDENGNKINGEKTHALKRIELYSRADRQQNGTDAKAIQVVEFTYNYELCQNYPSNTNSLDPAQRGKLTLKKVSVYSGKSYENQRSYYEFDYGSGAVDNPNFNYGNIDAWGQYKPGSAIYNSRFPYVEQQSIEQADNNAQAWKLKRIVSPNGGSLKVSYQSDRYAYVQDKRVMKHLKMEGLTNLFDLFSMLHENVLNPSKIRQEMNTPAATISAYAVAATQLLLKYNAFYGKFNPNHIPNNIVVFKLDKPLTPGSGANDTVKKYYFTDGTTVMKDLYLKAHIRVTDDDVSRTEIVPVLTAISPDLTNAFSGLYPIDDAPAVGVLPPLAGNTQCTYGYVILTPYKARNPKNEDLENGADVLNDDILEDEAFNPIQKVAYDFFQRSLADLVFQNTAFSSGSSSLDILTGAKVDISKAMRQLGFGSTLVNDYNTMRVYIPSNVKLGGNARVKSVEFSDNWQAISGEYVSNYTYYYIYDFGRGLSSGVASYESRTANDESPFYGWDTYYDIRVKFPDRFNYTPKPAMELLYPSGSVGYSKVAVQFGDLASRGYSVTEFFTAKDRPTRVDASRLHKETVDEVWKNQGQSKNVCGFSQGFSIETNDFHGKIKAQSIVKGLVELTKNSGEVLSETTYEYYKPGEKQKLADEKGNIENKEVGLEYDIHADSRIIENAAVSFYGGVQTSYTPIPFPHFIANNSYAYSAFYSHALIKHANRSAILKKVTTKYMGSSTSAENMVFDRYSGAVILSSSQNEFSRTDTLTGAGKGDKIYSLSYPAHWYYPEFRNVSASQDRKVSLTLGTNTSITDPAIIKQLSPGDLIRFPNGQTAHVAKLYPWPLTPKYFLITPSGTEYSTPAGTYNVIIISSGRTNQINAVMQQVETKTNPLTITKINFPDTNNILAGNAITFRDKLNALCGNPAGVVANNNVVAVGTVNPYLYGLRGDLVADNQLVWQSTRVQATANGVRKDGAYSSFTPYYAKDTVTGDWRQLKENGHPKYTGGNLGNWRKSGETTVFNQYGNAVEMKDPLKINSTQLYGYNPLLQLLPVAFAANAHKQDIAFDGFEDYAYYNTAPMNTYDPHFIFIKDGDDKQVYSTAFRHSGLYSALVTPGQNVYATNLISPFQEAKTLHSDNATNTGQVQNCDCVKTFSPTPGEYVVGAWVKQANNTAGSIKVTIYDGSSTPAVLIDSTFKTTGTALDGWQRIEGTLTIPNNAAKITVSLKNNGSGNVYFDDFRMHPFLAGMETAVYDPATLLKMASHDGYNYTTFYNYDENNQLVRVRVETSEGIKTVSESEMSVYKQQ